MLKSFVSKTSSSTSTPKRRAPVHVPTGDLECCLKPQQKLIECVLDSAREWVKCFDALQKTHQNLMRGVQAYLAFDISGLDASALALVQESSTFFGEATSALKKTGLQDVCTTCEHILQEHRGMSNLLKERDDSHREFEHYNGKIAGMLHTQAAADRNKFERNQEKLANAQRISGSKRKLCDNEVKALVSQRIYHTRATLIAALRQYCRTLSTLTKPVEPLVAAMNEEFKVGTPVEVIGFPTEAQINGWNGVISGQMKSGHLYVDFTGENKQQAFKSDHLVPVGEAASYPIDDVADDVPGDVPDDVADDEEEAKQDKDESSKGRLSIIPESGPSEGCPAKVDLGGLINGTEVEDVLVGGTPAKITDVSEGTLDIEIPPGKVGPRVRLEVRRRGWRDYVGSVNEAFHYFQAMGWGPCGRNVELSRFPSEGSEQLLRIASRPSGLCDAIVITNTPAALLENKSRYFEVQVLEAEDKRRTKAVSIGFAWPRAVAFSGVDAQNDTEGIRKIDSLTASSSGESSPKATTSTDGWGRLPEYAPEYFRGFVLGGDLPKAHLAGQEKQKLSGWRPLLDVGPGTTLGALLEDGPDGGTTLSVYQDGFLRCSAEVRLPTAFKSTPPHGLFDVCGHIKSVELREGAFPSTREDVVLRSDSESDTGVGGE